MKFWGRDMKPIEWVVTFVSVLIIAAVILVIIF